MIYISGDNTSNLTTKGTISKNTRSIQIKEKRNLTSSLKNISSKIGLNRTSQTRKLATKNQDRNQTHIKKSP